MKEANHPLSKLYEELQDSPLRHRIFNANAIYDLYKEALMQAEANVDLEVGNNIRWLLVDLADYTFSQLHDFLDDVPAGARVAESPNITGRAVVGKNFDHADFTFATVTGDPSEALIMFIETGVEATSRLVNFFDTGVTGLPVTPNGGDIDVAMNASGVFDL